MSKLASAAWWRQVLDRAVRQGVQVLTPFLLLASTGQIDGVTAENTAVAAGLAALAVVLKALAGWTADPADPPAAQVAERALGAAAGAALAILPLDLSGVLTLDVRTTLVSILGSVLLAFAGYWTNPPAGPPNTSAPVDAPVEGVAD